MVDEARDGRISSLYRLCNKRQSGESFYSERRTRTHPCLVLTASPLMDTAKKLSFRERLDESWTAEMVSEELPCVGIPLPPMPALSVMMIELHA